MSQETEILKKTGKQLGIDISNLHIDTNNTDENDFEIWLYSDEDEQIASINLTPFPGCCGICVINNIWVSSDYNNKRYASLITRIAELYAALEYTVAIGTIAGGNRKKMVSMLTKYGWTTDNEFKNRNTGNKVIIMTKKLRRK